MEDEDDLWALLDGLKNCSLKDGEGDGDGAGAGASGSGRTGGVVGGQLKRRVGGVDGGGVRTLATLDTAEAFLAEKEAAAVSETCGACGSRDVHAEDGQYVCSQCQSVLSRVIDMGAEWRFFGQEDSRDSDPTRCGLPVNPLMPKSSLGTVIGGVRGDYRDLRRIRRFQMWTSMPHSERQLFNVFDSIKTNTAKYGLPGKVIDDAIVLYKKASEQMISRGDNKDGLIASCIYHACLLNHCPRSAKEVAEMFGIPPITLTKGNTRFQNLLHVNVYSAGPDDFIGRFGSKLNMDYDDIQKCKAFVSRLDEMEIISENAPTSVAAGALFYYCVKNKIDFSKAQVAAACNVSEMTVVKCFKRLTKFKEVEQAL